MHLKRLGFLAFIAFNLLPTPFAMAQDNPQDTPQNTYALQTQNSPDVQAIFNTILSTILNRTPGSQNKASVELLETSDFSQGFLRGQWSLPLSEVDVAHGNFNVQIARELEDAVLTTQMDLTAPAPAFFAALSARLQSNISSLTDLKNAILQQVEALPVSAGRQRTLFSSPSEDPALTAEQKQALLASIDQSLQITNETALSINTAPLQTLLGEQTLDVPMVTLLTQLQSLNLTTDQTTVQMTITASARLPVRVIESYDAYLAETQKSPSQLTQAREIVQAMASTIVGMCSKTKYHEYCSNEILNKCARSVDNVETCVAKAESLRKAKEAKSEGDTLGVITNGANAALQEGAQAAKNAVNDSVNWIIGDEEESE